MNRIVHFLVVALTLIAAPLLPEKLRREWPWQGTLARTGLELVNSYLHTVAGVVFWAVGLVAYQTQWSDWMTEQLWNPNLNQPEVSLQHFGMLGFFSYLVSFRGLVLSIVLIDAIVRLIGAVASGTPPGTVFIWLPMVLFNLGKKMAGDRRRTTLYGRADEPDRVLISGDSMAVRCTRPHEAWHSALTFSHRERLYRLVELCEGKESNRSFYEYRFEPWAENNMIRKILVIEAPGESHGPNGPMMNR